MAGPLAAAIPASALAATAAPILSFRSEQDMRIAATMDVFRYQPASRRFVSDRTLELHAV
jgi:hypothetical protein